MYSQYHVPPLHGTLCIRCTVAIRPLLYSQYHAPPLHGTLCIRYTVAVPTTCVVSTMHHLCMEHSALDAPKQPRPLVYHEPPLHGTLCIRCTEATPTTFVYSVPCATYAWYTVHQLHSSNRDHLCMVSTITMPTSAWYSQYQVKAQ